MRQKRVIICGAGGRDFHNFNVALKDDPSVHVVAFTAAQIPHIAERTFPPDLAGPDYPDGIPIFDESELERLIRELEVDEVIFAYSDVSHQHVMEIASRAMAAGANFRILGPRTTQLQSSLPVVAVVAVRTGAGKSPTTRKIAKLLQGAGKKVVAVRHPMPYGDLKKQRVQVFENMDDLDRYQCTIEEREEYEPLINLGVTVLAGWDYPQVLREAERRAEIIIWDGGNNDFSFFKADLIILVADPHRSGHERTYFPSFVNLIMADVVIVNKVETALADRIWELEDTIKRFSPNARIIHARMPFFIEDPELIKGKRVLAIEDGPTLTHGGMSFGAAVLAAKTFGAKELIDPRRYAVGEIKQIFEEYPHLGNVLPAVGYAPSQIRDLEETIKRIDCDSIIVGTPIDLRRLISFEKPVLRVSYEIEEVKGPTLEEILKERGFI